MKGEPELPGDLGGTWRHPCEGSLDNLSSVTSLNNDRESVASEEEVVYSPPNSIFGTTMDNTKSTESSSKTTARSSSQRTQNSSQNDRRATQPAPPPPPPARNEALLNWDVRVGGPDGAHYIVSAANQITKAQDLELAKSYQEAFDCYRAAVGILLSGVQSDNNCARRDAVRRKTAQYLTRAEDIYRLFLGDEAHEPDRWAKTTSVSSTTSLSVASQTESRPASSEAASSSVSHQLDRRGDVKELDQFQVVGVLDAAVLLVRPVIDGRLRSEDVDIDGCYALKVVKKRNENHENCATTHSGPEQPRTQM